MPRKGIAMMSCKKLHVALAILLLGLAGVVYAALPEITDPVEAAKDPDFLVQGEYLGSGTDANGQQVKVGAQVIALGKGQFAVVLTKDGLPGEGWKRGEPMHELTGRRDGNAVLFENKAENMSGKIVGETMTVIDGNDQGRAELKRVVRHSPTEGAKPPAGAIVLFDGTSADNFENGKLTPDKNLWSNVTTKRGFGDYTLHLEFRLSYMPEARGQARSNSGVYLHDCYEVQVLDSFGLKGENNECGGFYGVRQPDVNMCSPPLTWQTYDIDFTAPRYKDGKKISNAKIAVRHNGVLIHPEFELTAATAGRQPEGPGPRPIHLQGHGNKVQYRNIWLKEKAAE
jgi:hypothetical protein